MAKSKGGKYSKKKLILNLFVVLIACLAIIIEINIFYCGFKYKPQKSDAIIVLGCAVWGKEPSPALLERINKAYELYKNGYGKKIIASGSQGIGEDMSEAAVIKKWLMKKGVPKNNIIEETNSTNTVENLKFSKKIMMQNKLESAIIVTNYFHIYRASMIAHDQKIEATYGKALMPKGFVYVVSSNIREILSLLKYFTLQIFNGWRVLNFQS